MPHPDWRRVRHDYHGLHGAKKPRRLSKLEAAMFAPPPPLSAEPVSPQAPREQQPSAFVSGLRFTFQLGTIFNQDMYGFPSYDHYDAGVEDDVQASATICNAGGLRYKLEIFDL